MSSKPKLNILMPSATEAIWGTVIIIATVIGSNVGMVQSWFYAANPEVITISNIVIRPIDELLTSLFGDASGYIAFIIFWMIIGLLVFYGVTVARNFSNELIDDASTSRYIIPVGTDKYARLRAFLQHTALQLGAFILLILSILILVQSLAPYLVHSYTDFTDKLLNSPFQLGVALVVQAVFMHIGVVLVRFMLLRERIIGSA